MFIVLFTLAFTQFFINWSKAGHPFVDDIDQYYSYLNAVFIDHNLSFEGENHGYWLIETPTHHLVPKVTYGMAFFYCPFYILAKIFSASGSDGYEAIYAWFIHLGCISYILCGLWFARKILLIWFSEAVTAVSLLVLFFGTNLFNYTLSESESVHGILFFLIAVFFYYVIKWQQTSDKKYFLVFCMFAGFICLIRPTECLIFLFPLLININSNKNRQTNLTKFISLRWSLIIGAFLFLLPILPQLFYWKIQSGQWLFFSYGSNEGFFLADPKLFKVLMSYRKGWLVYSPIMILSLIGFILLYKKNRKLFFPILIYFCINLYLISAWWDWAFGGSFGMRALIQAYVFLVIPLAYFIQWIIEVNKKAILKYCFAVFVLFFIALNLLQSNLYKHGIIDYDGMTKEAYWYTFFKKKYSSDDLSHLKTLIKHPNYDSMRSGNRNE